MNIFEYSTWHKLRFPSAVGMLTTEQLWELPLVDDAPDGGRPKPNLNDTAKAISAELKDLTEESFVRVNTTPKEQDLAVALEVVKYIIARKQEEAKEQTDKVARAQKKAILLEAYNAQVKHELVVGKSAQELLEQISALDD
jgi:hypothetical protein